ncbi:alpha/beta hydrolase fold [Actinopolyspora xinjiangensis]|uniref:Alpha/beta hydrolase fold n=1 Tax=Actinopolyspora xinjiangensis TaxID=405564 RepID=A0A1H0WTQ1_9ACTN|nr:alpha/beta fold hydrolase [Actinopolyspora xinjiangensis]SDP94108.1 alpha/beta hydrolase fold [Actinopolyspora xinjiangensis]
MSLSNSIFSSDSVWTGMVPVEDTALATTDTRGPGCPVVYLNGSYADQSHWRRVIGELGSDWRHITYDERARGGSKRSADYSFEACVRDVDAVLEARSVDRPILVGWSYGAALAVHWANRNPGRVLGVVLVDGAMPYDWIDDAARERIRTLFRRLRWMFPIARRLGLAARFSAEQHAEINIEINEGLGALGPVLDGLACPGRWVIASGGNLGGGAEEMERARASLAPALARNSNLEVSAKVASNHSKILRKDFRAVADAVREIASTHEAPCSREVT